jgi:hypothetical protein
LLLDIRHYYILGYNILRHITLNFPLSVIGKGILIKQE